VRSRSYRFLTERIDQRQTENNRKRAAKELPHSGTQFTNGAGGPLPPSDSAADLPAASDPSIREQFKHSAPLPKGGFARPLTDTSRKTTPILRRLTPSAEGAAFNSPGQTPWEPS
jgi:hypothetical protein